MSGSGSLESVTTRLNMTRMPNDRRLPETSSARFVLNAPYAYAGGRNWRCNSTTPA